MPSHSTLKRPFTHTLLFFLLFICSSPANIVHDNFQATGALYGNSSWLQTLLKNLTDYFNSWYWSEDKWRNNTSIWGICLSMALLIIAWTAGNWNAQGAGRKGKKEPKQHLPFLQNMNKGERFLNWAQQKNLHLPTLRSFPQPYERFLFKSPKQGLAGASQILVASSQYGVKALC